MRKIVMIAVYGIAVTLAHVVSAQVSFATIRSKMNTMTDAQFSEYAKTLKGQTVTWVGWVANNGEGFFGGYTCSIDMDDPRTLFSVFDVTFDVHKDVAIRLQRGHRVAFTGTIKYVEHFMGLLVKLENALILKQE